MDAGLVCVVAAEVDRGRADVVGLELEDRGLPVRTCSGCGVERGVCVVLVTPAAVLDVQWQTALRAHGEARLVPVAFAPLPEGLDIPPALGDLNFLFWNPADPGAFYDALALAVRQDVHWVDEKRILTAEAQTWARRGQPEHLLVEDRRRVAEARDRLREEESFIGPPDAELIQFLDRSRGALRRARRRRWLVRALRLVLVAALVGAFFFVKWLMERPSSNNYLTGQLYASVLDDDRPDRVGVLAAALYAQSDDSLIVSLAADRLFGALAVPWSSGALGANGAAPITAAVFLPGDADTMLAVDAMGTLTAWDTVTDEAEWRHVAIKGRADVLAVSADGSRAALGQDDGRLTLVDTDSWDIRSVTLPGAVVQIQDGGDGESWVATTADALFRIDADLAVHQVATVTEPLDLAVTDGGPRALVRTSSGTVALLDARDGAVLAEREWPQVTFDHGVLESGGAGVALLGVDGQVFAGTTWDALAPSGIRVTDLAWDLDLLPRGRLVVTTPQDGVMVHDLALGVPVVRICGGEASPAEVVVSGDGTRLGCLDDMQVELWGVDDLGPVARPAEGQAPAAATEVEVGPYRLVATDKGYRIYGVDKDFLSGLVSTAPSTAVAIRADQQTFLVGSADGQVVEVDIGPGRVMVVNRWQTPDRAPVQQLGWTSDGTRLLVGTAAGSWWSPRSCAGCSLSVDGLLDRVRERVWGCYSPNQIEHILSGTQELLGVRSCRMLMAPEGEGR
jgi:hypothetical protein